MEKLKHEYKFFGVHGMVFWCFQSVANAVRSISIVMFSFGLAQLIVVRYVSYSIVFQE